MKSFFCCARKIFQIQINNRVFCAARAFWRHLIASHTACLPFFSPSLRDNRKTRARDVNSDAGFVIRAQQIEFAANNRHTYLRENYLPKIKIKDIENTITWCHMRVDGAGVYIVGQKKQAFWLSSHCDKWKVQHSGGASIKSIVNLFNSPQIINFIVFYTK